MTTFFTPAIYSSIADMEKVSQRNAVSDTRIDGIDVFGYVDGIAYAATYEEDDREANGFWSSAGKPLNQYNIEGCCPHCGKSLSEYDGLCRWSDCVSNDNN